MLSLQFHNVNKNFKRPQKSEKIPCPKFKKMGIRGLDTYINKRAPNVRRPTNILNVAEETLRSKVLIVDLNCVLRSSYKDLSLVNGGDFALFKNRWRIFLQKLEMAKMWQLLFCLALMARNTFTSTVKHTLMSMLHFHLEVTSCIRMTEYKLNLNVSKSGIGLIIARPEVSIPC